MNVGDVVSLKLVERIVRSPVRSCHKRIVGEKKLLAVGSIFTFAAENDVVWGSGIHGKYLDLKNYHFKNIDVRSVRGPLTRQFLKTHFQIDCPAIYGDPVLLFPYFFPEFKKKANPSHEAIVILHYADCKKFPKEDHQTGWPIIYSTDPWYEVVDAILDSRFVISSSLHGVILAEAFGIPARYVRLSEHEPLFKFQDYYLGTNRSSFQFATSIEEAFLMGGEQPFSCDLKALYEAFPFDLFLPFNKLSMVPPEEDTASRSFKFNSLEVALCK